MSIFDIALDEWFRQQALDMSLNVSRETMGAGMHYMTRLKKKESIVEEAWQKAGIFSYFIVYSCGSVHALKTQAEWLDAIKSANDRGADILYIF